MLGVGVRVLVQPGRRQRREAGQLQRDGQRPGGHVEPIGTDFVTRWMAHLAGRVGTAAAGACGYGRSTTSRCSGTPRTGTSTRPG